MDVRAHPRSRGENDRDDINGATASGSSPLTRGKHPHGQLRRDHPRLIPAHAGKTGFRAARDARPPAHPRSRGENRARRFVGADLGGSSPLTRGKLSEEVGRAAH